MKKLIALMTCALFAGCTALAPEVLDSDPAAIEKEPAVAWFVC